MAVLVGAVTVSLAVRVDWAGEIVVSLSLGFPVDAFSLSRRSLTVGASGGAAVGVVTKGVDVEAALGAGVVAGDVPSDGGRSRLGLLLEGDGSGDLGVTTNDSKYTEPTCQHSVFLLPHLDALPGPKSPPRLGSGV